jgi:hypothetical protein
MVISMKADPRTFRLSSWSKLAIALLVCSSALSHAQSKPSPGALPTTKVPFVGCESDGQVGPREAPKGDPKSVALSPEMANQLAFYKGEFGIGVLAPRGWHCFEAYGSNGSILLVSPDPIDSKLFFSDSWKGFTGPAIQLTARVGDTSGRFDVAATIARVFPAHRAYVRRVIKEDIEPASDFPYGPYPKDKLTYRSKEIVEFHTPPNSEGMGTHSRLATNGSPVDGVAVLLVPPSDPDYDLFTLAARLPPTLAYLTPFIVHQVERDAESPELWAP